MKYSQKPGSARWIIHANGAMVTAAAPSGIHGMVSMSFQRRSHARNSSADTPGMAKASRPLVRKAKPAATPASASHPARTRPMDVHPQYRAPMESATNAANGGSSSATVPMMSGASVVACTMNASGPSWRRPVMRTAIHAATSATTSVASTLGRRMANALCPKTDMLAAVSQYPSGGFS